jgi:hypothetical protein
LPPAARRNGTQLASGAINGTIARRNERHACQRLVVAGQLSRYQATGPPALYLAPDGDRFLSREATGLKYRRARNKADRAMRRGFKLMQKLQTDHWGPAICQPPGMSERTFNKLEWRLKKEEIRRLCALLGRDDPEFHDEDPPRPKRLRGACEAWYEIRRSLATNLAPSR